MSGTSSETADIPARGKKGFSIALILALPAIVVLKMGVLFFLVGMLPTLLTLALIRPPRTYIVSTVAAFNFAGVFPDLLVIFLQQGRPGAVIDRLSDITVWCSMYGAALLGIAIVWLSPGIALLVMEGMYKSRMHHMEDQQKKLEEEWGPGITGRERLSATQD